MRLHCFQLLKVEYLPLSRTAVSMLIFPLDADSRVPRSKQQLRRLSASSVAAKENPSHPLSASRAEGRNCQGRVI
jgi:hypothetical protein